ncbi:MAG TPA: EAL domain-containing protein [Noviherbaspirillum sp.]|uniref:bifunctional diguanylate cyclase/phosphodiesterase n=1 Tax=Noviherbaspirillum sp. TaxID=1926288 RepID=UPI002B47DC18|nr:EAL domain-containing protein [Noviherbaspirillum sp.]HJV88390.1 EAL domain-containing protein [Noviherbaspirillum sp.]
MQKNTADARRGRARWLAWGFLIAGLIASTVVYWEGRRLVEQEMASQLDVRARDVKHNLERQLDAYAEALYAMQKEVSEEPALERAVFRHEVSQLRLKDRMPAVQAIGFSPRVALHDRAAFGRRLRKDFANDGLGRAELLHPALTPEASDSYVVQYIEPLARNHEGVGFDQSSEPHRLAAIERARDSSDWTASERIRLFVTPGDVDGVVFFAPVYRGAAPQTLEARRASFRGVVFLAIRVDEMLRNVFGPKLLEDLDIEIVDGPVDELAVRGARAPALIFDSNPYQFVPTGSAIDLHAPMRREIGLTFGGREWHLHLTVRSGFLKGSQIWLPPLAALAGVLMSFLAFFFMRAQNFARQASEAREREAFRSLHSKERQLDGILESIDEVLWAFDMPDRKLSYVSPAVERLYGYPAQAFYDDQRLWLECVHPEDRKQVVRFSRAIVDIGWATLQYRIVRPDGEIRWMHYDARYVRGGEAGTGRIDGLGRDITEARRMEKSLMRSNRALRAIHACDAEIATATDESTLLKGICEVVVREGYRMAWSGLLNGDGSVALAGIAGEHAGYMECIEESLREGVHEQEGVGTIGVALRTLRPVIQNNIVRDPRMAPWREQALRRGFNSKIALPMFRDDKAVGVLNVYATESDAFDADEVELLTGLAGAVTVAIQFLRHRSGQRAAEAAFRLRERAIEASTNGIVIASAKGDHPVEYVNPAFERMTGYAAEEIIGRNLRILHGDDGDQPGLDELREILAMQRAGQVTIRNYRKDGSMFWTDIHIAPVRDEEGNVTHFVASKYDVTMTKRYEAELEYQASRDPLTALVNRNLLRDRLDQALAQAARYGTSVWVAFIDLDRFKFVNDTLGHQAGDMLLKQVSERMLSAVRHSDTVARLGGDEFVLVLPEHTDEVLDTSVIQRVMDAIAPPFVIGGHEFFLTCSIGIASYPNDGKDAETLIKHADIAMYRAKEVGRDNFQFYTASMNEKALERLRLEGDLRNAVERGEFILHYQPQVDLYTGEMIGMEALIRWQHPELGMVPPDRFISLAEEIGLIVPIGAWVLRTACTQNRAWQRAGLGKLRVAVNLSARQFAERDLVQTIAAVLEETGLEPQYLDIELTESLVMTDVEFTTSVLRELKALGVHLSIDDFGTGYSSLSYLKRFPIDMLKIDRSFVRDITLDADDAAIVQSIISLAHGLRLKVIAEGVETEEQLEHLWLHGCDQMQGYYFSRPLAADAFETLLKEGKSLQAGTARRDQS